MGDWDYMVERGYGNVDGTLTDDFYDSCEENGSNDNIEYEYIKVELTPSQYLASNEKYIRAKIINNQELHDWNDFELMHDKANTHDSLAIQVFYKETFIGFIKKNNTVLLNSEINTFCFNQNILNEIQLNWIDNSFVIRRVLTEVIKAEHEKEKNRLIEEEKIRHKKKLSDLLEKQKHRFIKELESFKNDKLKKLTDEYLILMSPNEKNLIDVTDEDILHLSQQPYGKCDFSQVKVTLKLRQDILEGFTMNLNKEALEKYEKEAIQEIRAEAAQKIISHKAFWVMVVVIVVFLSQLIK